MNIWENIDACMKLTKWWAEYQCLVVSICMSLFIYKYVELLEPRENLLIILHEKNIS